MTRGSGTVIRVCTRLTVAAEPVRDSRLQDSPVRYVQRQMLMSEAHSR